MSETRSWPLSLVTLAAGSIATLAAPFGLVSMFDGVRQADELAVLGLTFLFLLPAAVVAIVGRLALGGRLPMWKIWTALFLAMFGGAGLGLLFGNVLIAVSLSALFVIWAIMIMRDFTPRIRALQSWMWLAATLDVSVLCATATRINDRRMNRERVIDAFQLTALPRHARVSECAVDAWLDYHESCAITLAPGEFKALVANTLFESTPCGARTHNPRASMGIGESFPVAHCYNRTDIGRGNFKRGFVQLQTDAQHHRVVMNWYED